MWQRYTEHCYDSLADLRQRPSALAAFTVDVYAENYAADVIIIIYFRLFNNPVDTPQPVTVYNYAIHKTQILTTNRTDSLQTQSISAQRGLELGTSRSLCQMLSNAPRACVCVCMYVCM